MVGIGADNTTDVVTPHPVTEADTDQAGEPQVTHLPDGAVQHLYQVRAIVSRCYFIILAVFRHGGEEGVTCNVIAFDSKSDQGKHKLLKQHTT